MFGTYIVIQKDLAQTIHVALVKKMFTNFSPASPLSKVYIEATFPSWGRKLSQGSDILVQSLSPGLTRALESPILPTELNAKAKQSKTKTKKRK